MIERLRSNYASLKICWNGGLKDHFRLSSAAFFILVLIFFVLGLVSPEILDRFTETVNNTMRNVVTEDGSIDGGLLLANNISACGLMMLYGFIPLVRLPALALGTNAMVMGCMAAVYVQNDVSLLSYVIAILPHGIFELPAMFLSFAMGLYICDNITRFFRRDKSACSPWTCTVWLARYHLLVLIPLLTAAALVEVYVTPHILALFF